MNSLSGAGDAIGHTSPTDQSIRVNYDTSITNIVHNVAALGQIKCCIYLYYISRDHICVKPVYITIIE